LLLWIIVLAALALRLAAIVALKSWEHPSAMEHRALAISLVNGTGFSFGAFGYYGPSSVQSPPYPLLLATFFKIFGTDAPGAYAAAMVVNALAGAATVWLTYLLTRALGGSSAVGLVAAALCAVWPTQIYPVTYAQAIVLITACMTAVMLLWQRTIERGTLTAWIGFSILGVLGALTEPVLLPIMALSGLLILVWPSPALKFPARLRNAGILLATAIIIIGPWSVRNRMVHGKWVPIKNTFWVNVWKGNNPHATGTDRLLMSAEDEAKLRERRAAIASDTHMRADATIDDTRQYDMLTPEELARLQGQPEVGIEEVFKDLAKTWISENPAAYWRLCVTRLGKTLWIDWDNPKSHNIVYVGGRAALLALTVMGLLIALFRRPRWALLYPALLIGSCILTYTLTITAARFSIPFETIQFCLAGLTIVSIVRFVVPRTESRDGEPMPVAAGAS
jgi:4-amino-4-deoxy-L-arabinose transferase-like glycosyltransferase